MNSYAGDGEGAETAMADGEWWRRGVIYQVYPRSFQDSNGDGVGDLEGIRRRLDYLVWLGVDAIWLSPFYPSPMADFGYDVADYCNVDPLFGDLATFDRLLADAHERGLKLIVDFVPNHSSDEHPWFKESRSSRTNEKRDWYIWRDPGPGGGPPNNWTSDFGGSAWTFDETTAQYYLHAFLAKQPDLNWRNPDVRAVMHDAMRFWLGRGVDGFRMDVIWHVIKDVEFRDNPINPKYEKHMGDRDRVLQIYSTDRPEVHEVIAGMRRVLEEYGPDRVLIGEIYLPIERLVAYYGATFPEAHLPFNFHLIGARWRARDLADLIARYESALPPGAWPNWVLGNHDRPRVATRVGDGQARVAAFLLLTLRGTPTIYYGDELGMRNTPVPPELVQDPHEKQEPGLGLGRDPVRTPMPWDASPNAGFTTGTPWLPLAADWRTVNVSTLVETPGSMADLHRRLLHLRRMRPSLNVGDISLLPVRDAVLAYERRSGGEATVIALNLSGAKAPWELSREAEILLSTHRSPGAAPAGMIELAGDEAIVLAPRR
jgi:alpha-glucosidase